MNIPYIKSYRNGVLSNPIEDKYESPFPNRKIRRESLQSKRFIGNGKQFPLTLTGKLKFKRERQQIVTINGTVKYIEHYQPIN